MLDKQSLQVIIKDRTLVLWLLLILVLSIVLAGVAIARFHVSDVQLPVRYSDYGPSNTYRDKWYYLLSFPLFAVFVVVFHFLLTAKLALKSRQLALGFAVATSVVLVFGIIVTAALFNLISSSL